MKQIFSINKNYEPGPGSDILLVEAGKHFCSVGMMHRENKMLHSFHHYAAESPDEDILSYVWQNHEELRSGDRIHAISYFTDESMLVPGLLYKEGIIPGKFNFPFKKREHASDYLESLNLYNIYTIPHSPGNGAMQMPVSVKQWHFFSVILKNINEVKENTFFIDFRTTEFSVIWFSKKGLQLCQLYDYSAPEDVIYYLLKICSSFSISRSSLHVVLSGFIEKDSLVFDELSKYFNNIRFEILPDWVTVDGAFTQYPEHYFISVCNLASCV